MLRLDDDFHKQPTLAETSPGATPPPSPLPAKIGPYKIESLLNKGGMSLLYLGIHPVTSQPLVIKVLLPKYLKNKEILSRFLKEAQIIALTNHPNIVKLYGQGQWEKGLYMAMEFIQGVSLRQFIQQKSLSQRRALEIVLQVAYALCHLHTHGVIHRDLKPENILITETGEIKVIDFGIAQLKEETEEDRITQIRRMMGTPTYMSPEQRENPESVSYASDIYSLGIIAYELLLGRLSHGVIHLSLLPKSIQPIIGQALKVDPKERYPDIVDFITAISHYLKTLTDETQEKHDETSEEMLELLQKGQNLLLLKQRPRWPSLECGLAFREGLSLGGLYLDAFTLSDQRYALALAEPLSENPASLLYTSSLRGMVKMAIELSFSQGKKEPHPSKFLHALSRLLAQDPSRQQFSFSLLLLDAEKDQLSFVSCGAPPLWHLPQGSSKPRLLNTPNPSLGTPTDTPLLVTTDNWDPGDRLLLLSSGAPLPKNEETPGPWFSDLLPLPPQPQAERLLHHLTSRKAPPSPREAIALTLLRT